MATVKGVPDTYSLTKTYNYNREIVYIFTDGEHYIFASGELSREGDEIMWQTISAPCKIGNAPY